MGTYEIKRTLMRPVAWHRRRSLERAGYPVHGILELHMFSKAVFDLSVATAFDPDLIHRADLDDESIVWDVGAFRGDGMERLDALYGARIYGFEPNPGAHQHMVERFADRPKVIPLAHGLGGSDETVTLRVAGLGSSMYRGRQERGIDVEVAIRDVVGAMTDLGLDHIDFIKINIEGAEYDLLDRLIESGAIERVRYLLIQFHEWHHRAHSRRRRIRKALRTTHEQVWTYDWLWELWCSHADPHPTPSELDEEAKRELVAALLAKAERAQQG